MRVLLLNMVKLIIVCKENRTSSLAEISSRPKPGSRIQPTICSILTEQTAFTSKMLEQALGFQVNKINSDTSPREEAFVFCIDSY